MAVHGPGHGGGKGCNVDNGTAANCHHVSGSPLRTKKCAVGVCREHIAPVGFAHLQEGSDRVNAGVIDEDVNGLACGLDLVENCINAAFGS